MQIDATTNKLVRLMVHDSTRKIDAIQHTTS